MQLTMCKSASTKHLNSRRSSRCEDLPHAVGLRAHMQRSVSYKHQHTETRGLIYASLGLSRQRRHSFKYQVNDRTWTQSRHPAYTHNMRTVRHRDSRGSRHTVETGHNVGLTAITSKCIWTPDGKTESHRNRGRRKVKQ